jgi:predicted dehydrogenase
MTDKKEQQADQPEKTNLDRRTILKAMVGVPVLGVFAWEAMKNLSYASEKADRTKLIIRELGLENRKAPKVIPGASLNKGDRLRIGIIGFGIRAVGLAGALGFRSVADVESRKEKGTLGAWMAQEDMNVELAGICDVFDLYAEKGMDIAKNGIRVNGDQGTGYPVKRYRTYKEMLNDKEIDAVIIATPEHHHAQMTIDAVQAGKHVYCEKSFVRTEEELHAVYAAVKSSNMVFQLGHQVTHNAMYQQAKEIIRKGILGKITLIETSTRRNSASGAWIRHMDRHGNAKPGNEQSIDWDQWLGDRPKVPFSIERFYNWSLWFDYSTGFLGQLFTHEFDAINQILGLGIPKSASSSGGNYFWKDNRESPDLIHSVFEYPERGLTLLYSGNLASSSLSQGRIIRGHEATMKISGGIEIFADKFSARYQKQISEGLIDPSVPMVTVGKNSGEIDATTSATAQYYASRGLTDTYINGQAVDVTYLHLKDWIDCIRNGGTPTVNIEMAFEEAVTVLMAHRSYLEKRQVQWDPVQRKIV